MLREQLTEVLEIQDGVEVLRRAHHPQHALLPLAEAGHAGDQP
ncbi:hypothetical protein ACN28I_06645 [Archangium gephyra]